MNLNRCNLPLHRLRLFGNSERDDVEQWPEGLRDIADLLALVDNIDTDDSNNENLGLGFDLGAGEQYEDIPDRVIALLQHAIGQDDAGRAEVNVGVGPERPRRLQRGRRQPYTITGLLRQTNWFEKSLQWENKWFRRAYR